MSDEQEILRQLEIWFEALKKGDAEGVSKLYAEDAILVPTKWDGPCNGRAAIRNYFSVQFLPECPDGFLINHFIHNDGTVAINSGHYVFVMNAALKKTKVSARFTFVYKKDAGGNWAIVTHHSSTMPEQLPEQVKEDLNLQYVV
jgi:uncharacterized protein (TIGR02246 family)